MSKNDFDPIFIEFYKKTKMFVDKKMMNFYSTIFL